MGSSLAFSIATGAVNVALVLSVAPLFEGILRKVTAKVQSRQGPPLWQPYYDLLKLLGKEDLESGEIPGMQRAAAYFAFAAILSVATLVPMGAPAPMDGAADAVLLVYLLTFCGVSTLLAALAAGSTYSLLGMSREMMAMMTLEPILAVAIVIGAVHTRSLRLATVLDGSAYAPGVFPWAGLVMGVVLLLSLQAHLSRLPFDISEAETEIMEGPMVEYSGPKLALFKYVRMAKLVVYSALFVALFVPWGNHLVYPVGLLVLLGKILVLVLAVTVVAATHARYRIDQAIRYYAGLFAASMVALGLAVSGY